MPLLAVTQTIELCAVADLIWHNIREAVTPDGMARRIYCVFSLLTRRNQSPKLHRNVATRLYEGDDCKQDNFAFTFGYCHCLSNETSRFNASV